MNRLDTLVTQIDERLKPLSLRERILVLLTPMVLVTTLIVTTLSDAAKARASLMQETVRIQKETLSLVQQRELLETEFKHRHQVSNDNRMALSNEVAALQDKLISPEDMGSIIRKILASSYRVRVLSLTNHAPEKLVEATRPTLYRHALTLELEGQYFDIIRYLQALETQGGMYWQQLHYEVKEYPKNRVKVEVFTVGEEEVLLRA